MIHLLICLLYKGRIPGPALRTLLLTNVSYENLSPKFRAFISSLDFTVIPKNIHIALALPKGHKTVGCKWVFTLKYKADGTLVLDKHKARLVAKGFY